MLADVAAATSSCLGCFLTFFFAFSSFPSALASSSSTQKPSPVSYCCPDSLLSSSPEPHDEPALAESSSPSSELLPLSLDLPSDEPHGESSLPLPSELPELGGDSSPPPRPELTGAFDRFAFKTVLRWSPFAGVIESFPSSSSSSRSLAVRLFTFTLDSLAGNSPKSMRRLIRRAAMRSCCSAGKLPSSGSSLSILRNVLTASAL